MCRTAFQLLVFFSLALVSPNLYAATYWLYPDGSGDFPNIQTALSNAESGDTVFLADGTYAGPGNRDLDFGGKYVTLASANGDPENCVINAEGNDANWRRGLYIVSGESQETIIQGLTFTGGYHDDGSAVYIAYDSSPAFRDCIFSSNISRDDGGAVFCWENCAPTFTSCQFLDNAFIDYGSQTGGGFYGAGSYAEFTDCLFRGNHALVGGAVYCTWGGNNSFLRCSFRNNQAENSGGVVALTSQTNISFTDCEFYQNEEGPPYSGGAVMFNSSSTATFLGCSFVDNTCGTENGGMIEAHYESTVNLENCVLAFNPTCLAVACADTNQVLAVSCTNVFGNSSAESACLDSLMSEDGNISADPLYCNLSQDDLGLMTGSPCLPVNNSCGVLMGVHVEGCDVAAVENPVLPPSGLAMLHSVHPNPFNPQAFIRFSLPRANRVSLKIFDLSGRLVRVLVDNELVGPGVHETSWNGRDMTGRMVAAGTYMCRLQTPDHRTSRPLTLIK